ncbi:MAG: hypothetical protein QOD30_1883 [Actinomycetota bacterium]|nr:hypothetical protein [Actinomycetota bacterium]
MRTGRLWSAVAIGIALVGMTAAFISADVVARSEHDDDEHAFELAAVDAADSMRSDLRKIEELVINAKVVLHRDAQMTTAPLRDLASATSLFQRHPALISIGVTTFVPDADLAGYIARVTTDPPDNSEPGVPFHLVPDGRRAVYCLSPARLSRPEARDALGKDYCAGVPADALDAVRTSDKSWVVPILLRGRQVVSVSTAIYQTPFTPSTSTERRVRFAGQLGLTFDPTSFVAHAVLNHPGVFAQLTYRPEADTAQLVGELHPFGTRSPRLHAMTRTVELGGGWSARLTTTPPRSGILHHGSAFIIFAVGSLGSLLLAALVQVLASSRVRALRIVASKTAQLQHQAVHDPLTGLANRTLLDDRATQLLARSRRNATTPSCLYLDIDGFKNINDSFGHRAGDRVLMEVGARLQAVVRDADTIARMGGDEFVILLEGGTHHGDPERVAARLLDELRAPIECEGVSTALRVSASVGIASGDRLSADDLIRDADLALYEAKGSGKDRAVTFTPGTEVIAQHGLELEFDLRVALERDQFRLVYQPIYHLEDLSVVGFEALLRWDHPTLGVIQPTEFVPVLERTGMIIDVGRWVIIEACRQLAVWRRAGSTLTVSVNVAARQLDSGCVVDDVRSALSSASLDPSALTVEITESSLMHTIQTCVQQLVELRELGVRIAVDDFGTGYSSLALLQRLPVDTLKIDRSFVAAMTDGPGARALVRTIAQLGTDLGLRTLAEGVETTEQIDELRLDHIDEAQGFLLARPLDPETIERTILALMLPGQLRRTV